MSLDQTIAKVQHAFDWCVKELHHIHNQLDTLEVPREVNGEKLSVSQRFDMLVAAYKSACTRVTTGE